MIRRWLRKVFTRDKGRAFRGPGPRFPFALDSLDAWELASLDDREQVIRQQIADIEGRESEGK